MKTIKRILLVCFSLCFFAESQAQDVNALLKERVDTKETPGIVVGIFENGKTTYYAYGVAQIDSQKPVDSKTLFEIGSITKTFTTTELALLVTRDRVKLTDPIQKFLPPNVIAPSRNNQLITFADLAKARSGLPRLPSNMKPADAQNPYIDYTEDKLFEFLPTYSLLRDIGSQYEYSNLGMGLLGVLVSRIERKTYQALITEDILKPLQMNSTFLNMPDKQYPNLAQGYTGTQPTKAWTWNDNSSMQGAGGLLSNAEDMIKYLKANLETNDSELARAMRLAHEPKADAGKEMEIGLGWHLRGDIVWHNGGTGGFRTFAGLNPKKNKAVIVLTNSTTGADDLGFHLIDPSLPLKTIRRPVEVPVATLQSYVGTYELTPQFKIEITRNGSQLFAQATGQLAFEIYPESETKFFYKVVVADIQFSKDQKNEVDKLTLFQNGQQLVGKRVK